MSWCSMCFKAAARSKISRDRAMAHHEANDNRGTQSRTAFCDKSRGHITADHDRRHAVASYFPETRSHCICTDYITLHNDRVHVSIVWCGFRQMSCCKVYHIRSTPGAFPSNLLLLLKWVHPPTLSPSRRDTHHLVLSSHSILHDQSFSGIGDIQLAFLGGGRFQQFV
jgi:hypothetical protein